MNKQDELLSQLGSDDYILEHAYLVERGVRPMAIVGHIKSEELDPILAVSHLETVSVQHNVIPFIVAHANGIADCGFASAKWVVDLYEWLVTNTDGLNIPKVQAHRIRGLLLGYSTEAIRMHDERDSGRRFAQGKGGKDV